MNALIVPALVTTIALAVGPLDEPSPDARTLWGPAPHLAAGACGLSERDGGWIAVGPDYKARFDGEGVVFTPVLGRTAPRNFPLDYRLVDLTRGGSTFVPEYVDARRVGTRRLTVSRSPWVDERWDVRPEGVEHSVVLHALPTGAGDLVARVSVASELTAEEGEGAAVDFRWSDLGGVTVDAVVGIDASGARVPGSIAFADGLLELRLPADFVDRAALPLVLDPLIGASQPVYGVGNNRQCDLAFDYGEDVYLLAWERDISFLDSDVVGLRVDPSGTTVGSLLALETDDSVFAVDPAVGNVRSSGRFLAVWSEGDSEFGEKDIVGRAVDPDDGGLSAVATIAGGSASQGRADVGNESTTSDDDALVVYSESGRILARQVTLPGTGAPTAFTAVELASSGLFSTVGFPAITESGGPDGRYLVAWVATDTTSSLSSIRGRVVSRNLSLLTEATTLSGSTEPYRGEVEVDGDGEQFLAVWSQRASLTDIDRNVFGNSLVFTGLELESLSDGPFGIADDANDDEYQPAVGYSGEGYYVVWTDETGSSYDLFGRAPDRVSGTTLEGQFVVSNVSGDDQSGAIATAWSGNPTYNDDSGLIGYDRDETIYVRRFESELGLSLDLEGGCGSGGQYLTGNPTLGNGGFEHRLVGAQAGASGFLVLSSSTLFFDCGGCTLWPDPFAGFVVSTGATDAAGNDSVVTPIPSAPALSGASVYAQWAIAAFLPTCTTLAVDLSNTRRLILE